MHHKDYIIAIQNLNDFEHFELWLKKLFYLNDSLQKEFDSIYQDAFYVKIYELFTEGLLFAEKYLEASRKEKDQHSITWYKNLIDVIHKLKAEFTKAELDFIEYKRNESCHIFLKGYDRLKKDLTENKTRKDQNLLIIQSNIYQVIKKLESLENGNLYFNNKIHPILNQLYEDLSN